MKFNQFIDRQDSLKRLRNALLRTTPQFLVIYGRRRIGKSTLIKEIMQDKDVYFLSDQTNEPCLPKLSPTAYLDLIRSFILIGKHYYWN